MPCRVEPLQPGAQYRDGLATGIQRALMRGAIDAQRQAAGDDETGATQATSEAPRVVHTRA